MASTLLFLAALGALALSDVQSSIAAPSTTISPNYVDRECGSDMGNLWLDVVVVVDNSMEMTNSGLYSVAAEIATVFSTSRIGVQANEPRTTRVGLVTYNFNATVVADLNKYQSLDDLFNGVFGGLGSVSSTNESYVVNGLLVAEQLFQQGDLNLNRSHYRKVIIVYAATYQGTGSLDPVPVANRLKAAGVTIITVDFHQDGNDPSLANFSQISSPSDNFSNTGSVNLVNDTQGALLQANCFCPNQMWTQYRSSFSNVSSHRYGICIRGVSLMSVWRAARLSCRNFWPNAYLVNEYNAEKHNFVLSVVQNTVGFDQPYSYHIGLQLSNGAWYWDQPVGKPLLPLKGGYNPWHLGYPVASSSLTAVYNHQLDGVIATDWWNINALSTTADYVCEVATCDTDNYCAEEN